MRSVLLCQPIESQGPRLSSGDDQSSGLAFGRQQWQATVLGQVLPFSPLLWAYNETLPVPASARPAAMSVWCHITFESSLDTKLYEAVQQCSGE